MGVEGGVVVARWILCGVGGGDGLGALRQQGVGEVGDLGLDDVEVISEGLEGGSRRER